jgi:hypothetical protein
MLLGFNSLHEKNNALLGFNSLHEKNNALKSELSSRYPILAILDLCDSAMSK